MDSETLDQMCINQGCTNEAGCIDDPEDTEMHPDICCDCFDFGPPPKYCEDPDGDGVCNDCPDCVE